jgi:twitching motility protein PilT
MSSLFGRLFGGDDAPEPVLPEEPEAPQTLASPADGSLFGYLRAAREAGASDVLLQAGSVPYARLEGALVRFDTEALDAWKADVFSDALCKLGGEAARRLDSDFCVEPEGLGRYRVNVHHQRNGWAASVKVIPDELPTLESLALPEDLVDLTAFRQGLVLVTGPSNCGKSSTLAALVGHVNRTRPDHVVTIEDPIEFVFTSDRANVTQREVGPHTRTFDGALRAALREDPDVVLVSEMRDLETIRTAIVAAETGHLVMGTLHTRDAISTVNRMVDLFPAREQSQVRTMLAGTLRAVVSQVLLPRKGGGRRVCAYELLRVTAAASTHIREGRTHQLLSLLQTGRRHGMIDLDARLQQLLGDGLIDRDTARDAAKDPDRFAEGGMA